MPANAPLDAAFPVTHWTLVHAAQGEDAEDAERAMEVYCQVGQFGLKHYPHHRIQTR